ncbi:MAG: ABC transporter ATP-binding protein [Desulfobacterales bacterium]|nr:MAG: ABC transporter ATP-binding protein [Desulfobacterales bacterium]
MSLSASRSHPSQLASTDNSVLSVNDLCVRFYTRDGIIRAVNDVSFYLKRGETLGIVGESGCGKSVMALSVMGLIPQPPGRIESGTINLEGRNLLSLSERDMRNVRGNEISMIFQEPMTSLNPVLKIGFQISESLMLHQKLSKREAVEKTVDFLNLVRIPEATQRMNEYPHQMSGGMRQRVMIAMALSCNPKVLIADEPTTALDVTIQAQILNLMLDLKKKLETAIIMITHDLGIIAQVADRVMVMYVGLKAEEAPVGELFQQPLHPYTRGLMASIPHIEETDDTETAEIRLEEIPGVVPSLRREIIGCAFAPRCKFATQHCKEAQPPLEEKAPDHWVACWETERVRTSSYA